MAQVWPGISIKHVQLHDLKHDFLDSSRDFHTNTLQQQSTLAAIWPQRQN